MARVSEYKQEPCPNCGRYRMQSNNICEKCEWDTTGGDYISVTGRCTFTETGEHEAVPGNNIMGDPFMECKYCHAEIKSAT